MYATVVVAIALIAGAAAQHDKKTDANVAGVWQMNVQGDHVIQVGMELKQEGDKITGTILMPTQHIGQRREVALTGTFVDGALKISGTVEGATEDTAKVEVNGTLENDGSMKGTLSAGTHSASWTGERLGR
jgi:hypothetical protein